MMAEIGSFVKLAFWVAVRCEILILREWECCAGFEIGLVSFLGI